MSFEIPRRLNIAEEFLSRPARECPARFAILGEPAPVRYVELDAAANRAGNALLASGCRRGDRVLIVLPDSSEFIAAFLGAAKIGAIAVPVNPHARAADYQLYLTDCGARFAVVHDGALAEFLRAESHSSLSVLIVVGVAPDHRRAAMGHELSCPLLQWDEWQAAASPQLQPADTSAEDAAFFLYTSGSGGTPKGAVHGHRDMLVCSRNYARGVLGLRADDITFSVSKLFFAYGLGNGMYFPLSVGAGTLLMPERPKPEGVADLVARYRPTVFFSVPTFYAAILREVDGGLPCDFSSVRLAVSAGESLPAEIFEQFRKRFGIEILDGIGSTEMLHIFISSRPGAARAGTCGTETPDAEVKIVDEAGNPVATGDIGNLWVKGESAFAEYWGKKELTARTKVGDWVITGDKFFRDADGFYHFYGRADDMLKISGQWVSPGEVENAMLAHPSIAEVAVIGRADSVGFVHAEAYVVLREVTPASGQLAQEIKEWMRKRLAPYKCPQEIHFTNELPKTATGKIQRFRLRDFKP
ncbi:MAG: benzoate-CoA ligase family protein [Candidatus Acidiferrales bacterium]